MTVTKWFTLALLLSTSACSKHGSDTPQPPKPFTGTTSGIKYQLSLPGDWIPQEPPDDGWQSPNGDRFERPHVVVLSLSSLDSLDDAIATAGDKTETVVRKIKNADGYSITKVDKTGLIRATTFRKAGERLLWCTASQANDDGIPDFEAAKAALEVICDSIAAK